VFSFFSKNNETISSWLAIAIYQKEKCRKMIELPGKRQMVDSAKNEENLTKKAAQIYVYRQNNQNSA